MNIHKWIISSLSEVPRIHMNSERNFKTHFCNRLENLKPLTSYSDYELETEFQKIRRLHKMRLRPDIILHKPHRVYPEIPVVRGNILVIQLKRSASPRKAFRDIKKLKRFKELLNYKWGYFINIESNGRTFINQDNAALRGNWKNGYLHEMSLYFENSEPKIIHLWYRRNGNVSRILR